MKKIDPTKEFEEVDSQYSIQDNSCIEGGAEAIRKMITFNVSQLNAIYLSIEPDVKYAWTSA